MATVDRMLTILVTSLLTGLIVYTSRADYVLARIALNATKDSCVTGLDRRILRTATYFDGLGKYRSQFHLRLCSRSSVRWELKDGAQHLRSIQAVEPVSWLPNDINVYSPAENLRKNLGKPDRFERFQRLDEYEYSLPNHMSLNFQVSTSKNVIVSVSVIFNRAMPNNSFKPRPLRGSAAW